MAFAELVGVAAIGPFMALVGDMSRLQGDNLLSQVYQTAGFNNPKTFLFWVGVAVLIVLALAAAISIYTTWRLSLYAQQVGAELSVRLYRHYMQQPWLFHASGSSSQLTNKISQECQRVTNQIIQPLMQMNAKSVLALFIASAIFIFNPLVSFAGLVIFGLAYFLLYRSVRRLLAHNGSLTSSSNRLRFKLMNEGFGGIKDTLLLGRQAEFNNRFESASLQFGKSQGVNSGLSQAPRYAMELVAFGTVIFLVLYLLSVYDGDIGYILPVLSIYALAGFKLLPAFQQIYASLTKIKGNIAAFDGLEADLVASQEKVEIKPACELVKLQPSSMIEIKNVTFYYPEKETAALKNVSLSVPVNQVVGLVGASGSGKSTLIDVLLGLVTPQQGDLLVDGIKVEEHNKRAWQSNVGFVPQTIFLSDASIRENIAFGLPVEDIDEVRIKRAVAMAHLEDLLKSLPDGLDTVVGERGVQLSGGQRQRIGIARALYDDAEVLVLDEATSALDSITEKLVMDAIHDFSGKKTIIMIAHRLSTVRQCDIIFLFESGQLVDSGSYVDLNGRNQRFQSMAECK
ncbi:ABC transporter ATP-binding protein [Oceanimonas sp. MB9]|uniref:ABC transporter ATP-binding protein n=1 Tax=Oceanimonas sp. MB9 TaxID=2588453 RepID=UPI00197F995E|nr:ABC transporter ATP-binding protein [Oceanimonas sp. MB9]